MRSCMIWIWSWCGWHRWFYCLPSLRLGRQTWRISIGSCKCGNTMLRSSYTASCCPDAATYAAPTWAAAVRGCCRHVCAVAAGVHAIAVLIARKRRGLAGRTRWCAERPGGRIQAHDFQASLTWAQSDAAESNFPIGLSFSRCWNGDLHSRGLAKVVYTYFTCIACSGCLFCFCMICITCKSRSAAVFEVHRLSLAKWYKTVFHLISTVFENSRTAIMITAIILTVYDQKHRLWSRVRTFMR